MTVETPQPLWQASRAARMTWTFQIHRINSSFYKHKTWTNISSTIEGEINTSVREFDEIILDFLTLFQSRRIDKLVCAKLPGPSFFFRIDVDRDNATSTMAGRGVDNTQSDCTTSENGNRRSLYLAVSKSPSNWSNMERTYPWLFSDGTPCSCNTAAE